MTEPGSSAPWLSTELNGRSVATAFLLQPSASAYPKESLSKSGYRADWSLSEIRIQQNNIIISFCCSQCLFMPFVFSLQVKPSQSNLPLPHSPDRPDITQRCVLCHCGPTGHLLSCPEAYYYSLCTSPEGTVSYYL